LDYKSCFIFYVFVNFFYRIGYDNIWKKYSLFALIKIHNQKNKKVVVLIYKQVKKFLDKIFKIPNKLACSQNQILIIWIMNMIIYKIKL